ncbi:hypothetical protein [Paracidovorax anthurii]|uniref:Uncharacterized protein n=1 Tax=Paracidovorax anthurii TaxID=78229 RepID=A0A328Z5J8_9BURK|nr:hypothetical protein [Paracidovorax anthurii]RAR80713.1 hypothetical protein AX018_102271 [Paracidovorax anthurii]
MSAQIAATLFNAGHAQSIAQSMSRNQADVLVLTPEEYVAILQDKARHDRRLEANLRQMLSNTSFGRYWRDTVSPNLGQPWLVPSGSAANDALLIAKTMQAIGIAGAASYVKRTPRGTFIIIKGRPGLRASLTGTRYLASHPRMVQLGLGMKGLQDVAKGGFILGFVISTGVEVLEYLMNDEKTMYDLVGGIGVEAVKGGLASLLAYGAATTLGMAVTVAVVPLGVMAVVVFGASAYFNALDNEYKIKAWVIQTLKKLPDQTAQGLYFVNTRVDSWWDESVEAVRQKASEAGTKIHRELTDWLCPIGCRKY